MSTSLFGNTDIFRQVSCLIIVLLYVCYPHANITLSCSSCDCIFYIYLISRQNFVQTVLHLSRLRHNSALTINHTESAHIGAHSPCLLVSFAWYRSVRCNSLEPACQRILVRLDHHLLRYYFQCIPLSAVD